MASLDAQLLKVKKKLNTGVKEKIVRMQRAVSTVAISQTTVDTGLAAANWQPSINVKNTDNLTHPDFGINPSTLSYPNERLISETAALRIATDIPEFRLGDKLYLTNSVPYLEAAVDVNTFQSFKEAMVDLAKAEANK